MRTATAVAAILLAALLLLFAFAPEPSFGQDKVCADDFDEVLAAHPNAQLLEPDELKTISKTTGQHVTRGFVTPRGPFLVMGLEVDGYLLPPIPLGQIAPLPEETRV